MEYFLQNYAINQAFPGLTLMHYNPPIFVVENFLSKNECQFLMSACDSCFERAKVVAGKGDGEIHPDRTNSSFSFAREDVPILMDKISRLTNKPADQCEPPQISRYRYGEEYKPHYDSFDVSEAGIRSLQKGGQRVTTVLVYLNDVEIGGQTAFPKIGIEIKPKQGTALVFFPATTGGEVDENTLHAALPAVSEKLVIQAWVRQRETDNTSKRLAKIMDYYNVNILPLIK